MPKLIDLTGTRFGRLIVLSRYSRESYRPFWVARCDCGTERHFNGVLLRSGKTKSCGCLASEMTVAKNTKHGGAPRGTPSRLYTSWCSMRKRCTDPNQPGFKNYGGRGIKVCERWNDFAAFAADMGPRPPRRSIERMNNEGDYEPGNCVWASRVQQARNTRRNRIVEHGGLALTVAGWAERTGLPYHVIADRMDKLGWPVARALSKSIRVTARGCHRKVSPSNGTSASSRRAL